MAPCQRFAQDLSDYADNELDKDSKGRLEAHLEKCPDCAKYLKHIQLLKTYLRELSPVKPTKDFVPVLRDRLRKFQQEKVKPERSFVLTGHRLIPLLGVGALTILIALLLVDQSPESKESKSMIAVDRNRSAEPLAREPVPELNRFRSEAASETPGWIADVSDADTLIQPDSTIRSPNLNEIRSRIRAVSN